MNSKTKLLKFLEFLKVFNFTLEERENKILVQQHPLSLIFELVDIDTYYFYIYYRTSSHYISGERTDLHDLIPVIIATGLRVITKTNYSLINIANEFSGIDSEIYSKYIIPSQPDGPIIRLINNEQFEEFKQYFMSVVMVILNIYSVMKHNPKSEYSFNYDSLNLQRWAEKINLSLNVKNTSYNNIYIKESINPNYLYYKNVQNGLTVVNSNVITDYLNDTTNSLYKYQTVEGLNCSLLISEQIKNVVYFDKLNQAQQILKNLDNFYAEKIIPFDNYCILIGTSNFVIFENKGDFNSFLSEKENIRQRHLKEVEILFNDLQIKWNITSLHDSEIFEDLILELLEKEKGILTAKKVAPTNQPDNGRDLIAYYTNQYTNAYETIKDKMDNIIQKKLIVQCKTNFIDSKKQSIGKNDVNIADTLMYYEPNGYLLVVNTQITRDLTEYLEKIKNRNQYYINWWNKNDIEKRLRENPEIINKYKQIVYYLV